MFKLAQKVKSLAPKYRRLSLIFRKVRVLPKCVNGLLIKGRIIPCLVRSGKRSQFCGVRSTDLTVLYLKFSF